MKDKYNRLLKKTKLNKMWFPFSENGLVGEIRIVSFASVVPDYSDSSYNIEYRILEYPEGYKGGYFRRNSRRRNHEVRYVFRYGEGGCGALSMVKFFGIDVSYPKVKTIKMKQ